jgi:hypothetical protein
LFQSGEEAMINKHFFRNILMMLSEACTEWRSRNRHSSHWALLLFFCSTGAQTRALNTRQMLYHWVTSPVAFGFLTEVQDLS